MNKISENNKNRFNTQVINLLAKKYGFSDRYIKQILSNDRSPVISDQIKKEYKALINNIEENLNNHLNK